jgi:hypothetical protein
MGSPKVPDLDLMYTPGHGITVQKTDCHPEKTVNLAFDITKSAFNESSGLLMPSIAAARVVQSLDFRSSMNILDHLCMSQLRANQERRYWVISQVPCLEERRDLIMMEGGEPSHRNGKP